MSATSHSRYSQLDELRAQQQSAWEAGHKLLVEELIKDVGPELDESQLLELIYAEITLRSNLDKDCQVDEYCQRFPQFAIFIRRLFAIHSAISSADSASLESPSSSLHAIHQDMLHSCQVHELDSLVGLAFRRLFPVEHRIERCNTIASEHVRSEAGRYRVLRPHARGGIGEVFVAFDQELHREVALKEIQSQHLTEQANCERFVREAEVTGGLEHPGVVPVYSLGQHANGRPYYAMRFIRGISLKEAIDQFHTQSELENKSGSAERSSAQLTDHSGKARSASTRENVHQPTETGQTHVERMTVVSASDSPPTPRVRSERPVQHTQVKRDQFQSIEFRKLLGRFIDVCQAIEYAHSRGVLHRDLKPANVMLGKYGETLVVDWGLAKATGKDDRFANVDEVTLVPVSGSGCEHTLDGSVIGTPAYMSPEQASGRLEELGPATDIYSLGATLYHLLAGQPPFTSLPLREMLERVRTGGFVPLSAVNPQIPRALQAICLKAMSRHPKDRYSSALELAEDLEHWLADEPVVAERETVIRAVSRWFRHHRAWALSGTIALGLTAAIAVLAAIWINAERNSADYERSIAVLAHAEASRQFGIADAERRVAKDERTKAQESFKKAEQQREAAEVARLKAQLSEQQMQRALLDKQAALEDARMARDEEARQKKSAIAAKLAAQTAQQMADDAFKNAEVSRIAAVVAKDKAVAAELQTQATLKRVDEERTKALAAQQDAEHARRLADQQKMIALYALDLREIQGLIRNRNLEFAQRILIEVPVERRSFEWALLARQSGLPAAIRALNKGTANNEPAERPGFVGELKQRIINAHQGSVYALAFSPDQKLLASAGSDSQICLWRTDTWTLDRRLIGHQGGVRGLVFIPDQARLASAAMDRTVRIWNITTGTEVRQLSLEQTQFYSLAVSPDGRQLFAGGGIPDATGIVPKRLTDFLKWGGTAACWNIADDYSMAYRLTEHTGIVRAVTCSPDGTRLVTAGYDAKLFVWDAPSGRLIHELMGHQQPILGVAFSPTGTTLCSVAGPFDPPSGIAENNQRYFGAVRIWDVIAGQELAHQKTHESLIYGVSYAANGSRILTGSADQTLRVWDAETRLHLLTIAGFGDEVLCLASTPSSDLVVTAGKTGTLQIWDGRVSDDVKYYYRGDADAAPAIPQM